jgi:glycine/serine hydroxymethyltransferase
MAVVLYHSKQLEYNREQTRNLEIAKVVGRVLAERGHRLSTSGTNTHTMVIDPQTDNLSGFQVQDLGSAHIKPP